MDHQSFEKNKHKKGKNYKNEEDNDEIISYMVNNDIKPYEKRKTNKDIKQALPVISSKLSKL